MPTVQEDHAAAPLRQVHLVNSYGSEKLAMWCSDVETFTSVIGEIYEAAFIPEKWPHVLEQAVELSDGFSGQIFLFGDNFSPRGECLENVRPLFDDFISGDYWKFCDSAQQMCSLQPASFVHVDDFMTAEQIERDPARIRLRAAGIGAHLCTAIPIPSGEVITFVFQRRLNDGAFKQGAVDRLNELRPHLARASLVAARLRLERAETTVSALKSMNLPAAVMTASGRVLATNDLFDHKSGVFRPLAHGGMEISSTPSNKLFQQALVEYPYGSTIRSIPVPAKDGQPALVVHLLPLYRAAQDIFSGADILVVTTSVSASRLVPSPAILTSLFDLTPAEAKLAGLLTAGRSLKDAATECRITIKSARTYLERIFRKTGITQQSQLVALLQSAQTPRAANY
ncbi:helix-turn-helix transcriptional regulator [Pararhizobium sp. LjRoot255]|uniref:helix-turn-helix transcriptional regulator n=1 Tax=Pararhizobium sp. LjRoot255 TaxID=3342298 RepID=UPI003ECE1B58